MLSLARFGSDAGDIALAAAIAPGLRATGLTKTRRADDAFLPPGSARVTSNVTRASSRSSRRVVLRVGLVFKRFLTAIEGSQVFERRWQRSQLSPSPRRMHRHLALEQPLHAFP